MRLNPHGRSAREALLRKIDHLPNAITISRIGLAPLLILLLRAQRYPQALAVFVIAGISDALDGYVAKRYGLTSQFGSILDPFADKILLISAYVMLAILGRIPFWLMLTVAFRDLLIIGGYLAYTSIVGSVHMRPSLLSKLNTVMQILLVVAVLAQAAMALPISGLVHLLVEAVFVSTVASGAHYLWTWGIMKEVQPLGSKAGHD